MNTLDLAYFLFGGVTYPVWSRKVRAGWDERFGKGAMLANPTRPRIMLHAVSVGEVNALRKLVPMLASEADVVVTVTTDTGMTQARRLFEGQPGFACTILRYPLDFSWAVDRFLNRVRPDVVALVELEVWPNFIIRCRRRGVPVGVVNGRLSDKSIRGYRFGKVLIGNTFQRLDFVCAQDEVYADRFRSMGIDPDRVSVTGSMKWDAVDATEDTGPNAASLKLRDELGIDPDRVLIVAGSTSEGEETLFHEVCPEDAQLLCAPRKPERFDHVASEIPGCVRVSTARTEGRMRNKASNNNRYLLDSLGDLSAAYRLADVVVLGRSFYTGRGGSDPLEPAGLGKPVVVGKHTGNFQHAVRLLQDAGGLVTTDTKGLSVVLKHLVRDRAERIRVGDAGRACVATQQGASCAHAEMLLDLARTEPAWADIGDSVTFGATK